MLVLASPYFGRVQFTLKLRSNFSHNYNNDNDDDNNNNNNNGNFICVFECTIVNLATYRQFINAA